MDFLNDLGKKFSNVARSVTEKTKESVEVTRISGDLRSASAERDQLFAEYGRACYDIHMGAGDPAAAEELANCIQKVLARIDLLSAQRDELRAVRRCTGCGAVQPKTVRFCPNCGKRMPEDAPKAEPEANPDEFCDGCGAAREPGSKFCAVCGKPFEEEVNAPAGDAVGAETTVDLKDVEEPDLSGEDHQE